jgi:2-polyprenyl-3-methyl-5-hydroxy-6-metoxy-1,4-benzoquinol methylase
MFAQLPAVADARVLEVGAGIGTFSGRLLEAGARELLLLEPEQACVAELQRRFAGDARVEIRAEELPSAPSLATREFDVAVSQNVLEHIEDDEAALRAMAQTLRLAGGCAIEPAPTGSGARLYGCTRHCSRPGARSSAGGSRRSG